MLSLPKLLVFVLVITAIWFFFFRKKRSDSTPPAKDTTNASLEESMNACPKCGTFVALDDAIIKDGRYYCSKTCAELL